MLTSAVRDSAHALWELSLGRGATGDAYGAGRIHRNLASFIFPSTFNLGLGGKYSASARFKCVKYKKYESQDIVSANRELTVKEKRGRAREGVERERQRKREERESEKVKSSGDY